MSRGFISAGLGLAAAALAVTAATAPLVRDITYLFPGALPPGPYWIPSQGLRLYVVSPAFASAFTLMVLAPGVLLVLGTGGSTPGSWTSIVAKGFLVGYGLRCLTHSAVKLAGGTLTPTVFWATEVILVASAAAILLKRWGEEGIPAPEGPLRRLLLVAVVPALAAVILTPIIFWQDFTEDGLEALEIGWSLTHYVVPRFPSESGFMGLGIGMLSMAPPVSWTVQILGPVEAAARIPVVVYLPVLAMILIGLAELGGQRKVGIAGEAMVLLVLAGFVGVMAYSATYDAYAADLSAPTAFETLTLVCISATVLFLWEGSIPALLGYVLLGYFARPTVLMWVAILLVATVVTQAGDGRRRMLKHLLLALGACIVAVTLYERVVLSWIADGGMSYDAGSVLDRYRYLRFFDLRRFWWVMIPGGLLAFPALFLAVREGSRTRQLAIALLAYFAAFFFPAFVALHHFAPVMVLPVVVLIRLLHERPAWLRALALAGCVAGVALSLPRWTHVDRSSRSIGERFLFQVGQYGGDPVEHRRALESRSSVFALFPATWSVDASEVRVGASLPFLYYSYRAQPAIEDVDYVVAPISEPPPSPFFEVGRVEGVAAFARDSAVWAEDLADAPTTMFGNPSFVLPPETLFPFVGAPEGAYDVDLNSVPVLWRFF